MIEHISSHRLFADLPLKAGATYVCGPGQNNYLLNVLRLDEGAGVLLFNGADGEWLCELRRMSRKKCSLVAREQVRKQDDGPAIHYLFAPLKKGRLDYMVQKGVELGVASMRPVLTRRTNVSRIKSERMAANMIEAAEQCGVLRVPELREAQKFPALLQGWDPALPLVFCDEGAALSSPLEALGQLGRGEPLALLIGPEGGFDEEERTRLNSLPFVHAISLGPRIMRADTAAVAALALVNAVLFDWR